MPLLTVPLVASSNFLRLRLSASSQHFRCDWTKVGIVIHMIANSYCTAPADLSTMPAIGALSELRANDGRKQ